MIGVVRLKLYMAVNILDLDGDLSYTYTQLHTEMEVHTSLIFQAIMFTTCTHGRSNERRECIFNSPALLHPGEQQMQLEANLALVNH